VELRQLVYFEAVVRCGGFSRAAQHLRVAQPAVSAQVRRLEAELGTALLERTTRRVTLTQAGELFLTRARAVLDQLDQARADLAELAGVMRGRLRVGATQGLAALDVPGLVATFHRRYPGVTLALRTGLVAKLLHHLAAGELDVVLGPIHADLAPGFVAEPLVTEELVLVSPTDAGLPAGPVSLDRVRDEPFVCLAEGSGLHRMLLDAGAAAGFEPRVVFETHRPASIRELVAAGLGVALLASANARGAGPDVRVNPLVRPPEHPPVGLIRVPSRDPVVRAWRAHVREAYPAPGA
jgi:LysR family transcriptional regulator, transcription activator of glutamate synthase operon